MAECALCTAVLFIVGVVLFAYLASELLERLAFLVGIKRRKELTQASTVVITGALNGIGEQLCYRFARASRCKIVALDRDARRENEVRAEVKRLGAEFAFYACDLSDESATERVIAQVLADYGTLDVVVNNAGITSHERVEDLSLDRIRTVLRVNYLASAQIAHTVINAHLKQVGGNAGAGAPQRVCHIVNIASIVALAYGEKAAEYAASKSALLLLSESLRQEIKLMRAPVKITEVLPYVINTGMFDGLRPRLQSILPILDKNQVADTVYNGIIDEREQIFIPQINKPIAIILRLLPSQVSDALLHFMQGDSSTMKSQYKDGKRF